MLGYPSSVRITMPVRLKDLREAFEFVCAAGGGGEHQAFLCKQSGKLYCHSDLCDDLDILPDDVDDSEKFLLSIAETNCAKWRLESVPVGLREKGFEARCYFCFFVLIYNLAAGSPSSGNFGLSVLS